MVKVKKKIKRGYGRIYRISEVLSKGIPLAAVLIVSAILAGILYVMIVNAPYALTIGNRMIFVIPLRTYMYRAFHQTLVEAFGVTFMLILTTAGMYLIIYSIEKVRTERMANSIAIIGVILLALGTSGLLMLAFISKGITLPLS